MSVPKKKITSKLTGKSFLQKKLIKKGLLSKKRLSLKIFLLKVRGILKAGKFREVDLAEVAIKRAYPRIKFTHPKVIRLFRASLIPLLKQIAVKHAIKSKDSEIEMNFIKTGSKKILMKIADSSNVDTLIALGKSKNCDGEIISRIIFRVFKQFNSPDDARVILLEIINNKNTTEEQLLSVIYKTFDPVVITALINSKKINAFLLQVILHTNYNITETVLAVLKSKKATKDHFIFAVDTIKDPRVLEFCAKSKIPEVLERMAMLNILPEILIANPYITEKTFLMIIMNNIERNPELVMKVLSSPRVAKMMQVWFFVIRSTNNQTLLELCASSPFVAIRKYITRFYARKKLSKKIIQKLLNDPSPEVVAILKNHLDENVRMRVVSITTDMKYLLEQANNDPSMKVKKAIARRRNLTVKIEKALLKFKNDELYKELAKKKSKISIEAEEIISKHPDKKVLLLLAGRGDLNSDIAIKRLAKIGFEDVQLMLLKKSSDIKVHRVLAFYTRNFKVVKHIFRNSPESVKTQLVGRFINPKHRVTRHIVEIASIDSSVKVRLALLNNLSYQMQLWKLIKLKIKGKHGNPYLISWRNLNNDKSAVVKQQAKIIKKKIHSAKSIAEFNKVSKKKEKTKGKVNG